MDSPSTGTQAALQLYDLILDSTDISEFLDELVTATARSISGHAGRVWCAVLLVRPKRPITVASSAPEAEALDEVQYNFDDGPCLTAAREDRLVYLEDTLEETRWPDYRAAATEAGVRSALGVPLDLGGDAAAALDVYSDRPHAFDASTLEVIHRHTLELSTALRLAVRLAHHRETETNLRAALASRTEINLAAGILMGRHQCSQDQAVEMLRAASSHRNVKLRDLAGELVRSVGQGAPNTHFVD
ncbi:ANTAR domain-containing protein [Citricoccus sp. SGAir0253]|uniref:GAF and ANTAR domain-containing protein n=1 Tax=Citricoccus sp. SGAir0253 TaxID=2567881 RepID=UPI0010CD3859|nr:GAF and ANTAR domain-containing protein [Citricoccus sp. SGAir0253]QCU79107.1 ANTAR domain-containing protein [Citricoccus sp. SGAir0253]